MKQTDDLVRFASQRPLFDRSSKKKRKQIENLITTAAVALCVCAPVSHLLARDDISRGIALNHLAAPNGMDEDKYTEKPAHNSSKPNHATNLLSHSRTKAQA